MQQRDAFVEHCLEMLSPLGVAQARSMFGGHGLRLDGVFIGLVAFHRLYLKTDAQTRPQFANAGCEPFVYAAKGKPMTLSFWTVPAQALESSDSMRPWAQLALQAALRAQSARRPAPARKTVHRHPRRGKT
mgnify:CR=1 FL=1